MTSHQNYVRLAKQNKRVQFKSLDCWQGARSAILPKHQSQFSSLDSGGGHYAFSRWLTRHFWDKRDTTDTSCERPNCATRWTMRRRKYDFMRGGIVITRSSSCHWTCAKSFHFISSWFDEGKNLSRGKSYFDKENSVLGFKLAEKRSHKIDDQNVQQKTETVGFIANLLSSIALIPAHHLCQRVVTCIVFDQVFDDFEVSVKAGCSQGGWVCLCGWVDVCPTLHQQAHYFQVAWGNVVKCSPSPSKGLGPTCCSSAP